MDIEDWWLQVSLAYPFGHHQPLTLGGRDCEVMIVKIFFFSAWNLRICKLYNKPIMFHSFAF